VVVGGSAILTAHPDHALTTCPVPALAVAAPVWRPQRRLGKNLFEPRARARVDRSKHNVNVDATRAR
jgi:hypothetical protein